MLFRLANKDKSVDGLIEINCSVKEMEKLIKNFQSEKYWYRQELKRFVEWINSTTPHVAQLLHNPVLFELDF